MVDINQAFSNNNRTKSSSGQEDAPVNQSKSNNDEDCNEPEEGQIIEDIDEFENISSDEDPIVFTVAEEASMRKRIEELEIRNAELEQIAVLSVINKYELNSNNILRLEKQIPDFELSDYDDLKTDIVTPYKKKYEHYQKHSKINSSIQNTLSKSYNKSKKRRKRRYSTGSRNYDENKYKIARIRRKRKCLDSPANNTNFRQRENYRYYQTRVKRTKKKRRNKNHNYSSESYSDSEKNDNFELNREKLRKVTKRSSDTVPKGNLQNVISNKKSKKENENIVVEINNNIQNESIEKEEPRIDNINNDDSDSLEEQTLRLIALKSAIVKKHFARKKRQEIDGSRPYSPTDFDYCCNEPADVNAYHDLDDIENIDINSLSPSNSSVNLLDDKDNSVEFVSYGKDNNFIDLNSDDKKYSIELSSTASSLYPILVGKRGEKSETPVISMLKQMAPPPPLFSNFSSILKHNESKKQMSAPDESDQNIISRKNLSSDDLSEEEELALRDLLLSTMNTPKTNNNNVISRKTVLTDNSQNTALSKSDIHTKNIKLEKIEISKSPTDSDKDTISEGTLATLENFLLTKNTNKPESLLKEAVKRLKTFNDLSENEQINDGFHYSSENELDLYSSNILADSKQNDKAQSLTKNEKYAVMDFEEDYSINCDQLLMKSREKLSKFIQFCNKQTLTENELIEEDEQEDKTNENVDESCIASLHKILESKTLKILLDKNKEQIELNEYYAKYKPENSLNKNFNNLLKYDILTNVLCKIDPLEYFKNTIKTEEIIKLTNNSTEQTIKTQEISELNYNLMEETTKTEEIIELSDDLIEETTKTIDIIEINDDLIEETIERREIIELNNDLNVETSKTEEIIEVNDDLTEIIVLYDDHTDETIETEEIIEVNDDLMEEIIILNDDHTLETTKTEEIIKVNIDLKKETVKTEDIIGVNDDLKVETSETEEKIEVDDDLTEEIIESNDGYTVETSETEEKIEVYDDLTEEIIESNDGYTVESSETEEKIEVLDDLTEEVIESNDGYTVETSETEEKIEVHDDLTEEIIESNDDYTVETTTTDKFELNNDLNLETSKTEEITELNVNVKVGSTKTEELFKLNDDIRDETIEKEKTIKQTQDITEETTKGHDIIELAEDFTEEEAIEIISSVNMDNIVPDNSNTNVSVKNSKQNKINSEEVEQQIEKLQKLSESIDYTAKITAKVQASLDANKPQTLNANLAITNNIVQNRKIVKINKIINKTTQSTLKRSLMSNQSIVPNKFRKLSTHSQNRVKNKSAATNVDSLANSTRFSKICRASEKLIINIGDDATSSDESDTSGDEKNELLHNNNFSSESLSNIKNNSLIGPYIEDPKITTIIGKNENLNIILKTNSEVEDSQSSEIARNEENDNNQNCKIVHNNEFEITSKKDVETGYNVNIEVGDNEGLVIVENSSLESNIAANTYLPEKSSQINENKNSEDKQNENLENENSQNSKIVQNNEYEIISKKDVETGDNIKIKDNERLVFVENKRLESNIAANPDLPEKSLEMNENKNSEDMENENLKNENNQNSKIIQNYESDIMAKKNLEIRDNINLEVKDNERSDIVKNNSSEIKIPENTELKNESSEINENKNSGEYKTTEAVQRTDGKIEQNENFETGDKNLEIKKNENSETEQYKNTEIRKNVNLEEIEKTKKSCDSKQNKQKSILRKSLVKNVINNIFEDELDKYLKNARTQVDIEKKEKQTQNSKLDVPEIKSPLSTITKSSAVGHLPEASQREYLMLVNRMKILERQKLMKAQQQAKQNIVASPVQNHEKKLNQSDLNNSSICNKNSKEDKVTSSTQSNEVVKNKLYPNKTNEKSTKKTELNLETLKRLENLHEKNSNSMLLYINKTIELVKDAKDANIKRFLLQKKTEQLKNELKMCEDDFKIENAKISKIYPAISKSYDNILNVKNRRTKLNQLSTQLGKNLMGTSYRLKEQLDTEIELHFKQLSNEICDLTKIDKDIIENESVILQGKLNEAIPTQSNSTRSELNSEENESLSNGFIQINSCEDYEHIKIKNNNEEEITLKKELNLDQEITVKGEIICKTPKKDVSNKDMSDVKLIFVKYDSPLPYSKDSGENTDMNYYIDPNNIMCPYELMGRCDDVECTNNHFQRKT